MNSNIFSPHGSFIIESKFDERILSVCLYSGNEIPGPTSQQAIELNITRPSIDTHATESCNIFLSINETESLISKFADLLYKENPTVEKTESPKLNPASQKLLMAIQLSAAASMKRENERMTNKLRHTSVDYLRPPDHHNAVGVIYQALKAKGNPAYQRYLSTLSIVHNMVECNVLESLYTTLMDKFSEYDLSKHPDGLGG